MRKKSGHGKIRPYGNWIRLISPVALALIVAIGGAMLTVYETRKDTTRLSNTAEKVDVKKEALPPKLDDILPATIIQEVAVNSTGSQAADIALENRSGVLIYVVTMSEGATRSFNAVSGKSVELPDGETANDSGTAELPPHPTVNTSFEDAREIAQDAFPNGKISRIHLQNENGGVIVKVRFEDTAQIVISAENGSVIRVTTSTGATAEAPTPSPDTPSEKTLPETTAPQPPDDNERPSPEDKKIRPDRPTAPRNTRENTPVHIEGTLTMANGIYTITEDGTTFVIKTDKDIHGLVDQKVRVEGKLQQETDIIDAANVHIFTGR